MDLMFGLLGCISFVYLLSLALSGLTLGIIDKEDKDFQEAIKEFVSLPLQFWSGLWIELGGWIKSKV